MRRRQWSNLGVKPGSGRFRFAGRNESLPLVKTTRIADHSPPRKRNDKKQSAFLSNKNVSSRLDLKLPPALQ